METLPRKPAAPGAAAEPAGGAGGPAGPGTQPQATAAAECRGRRSTQPERGRGWSPPFSWGVPDLETTILGVIGLAGGVVLMLAGLPWWLAAIFTLLVAASWAAVDKKRLFA